MNAAIYLRVSTDRCRCGHVPGAHSPCSDVLRCSKCDKCVGYQPDQDESNQEPACRQLCEARGWSDPLVIRERVSGAKHRPEWRGLVEKVRRGEVTAVVFWAVDRIGRNKVQSAHDLRELARFGAQLVSIQDAWVDQPEGPMRTLMIDIITWVAEGERARLIERTKAGMLAATKAGKRLGRPTVPVDVDKALHLLLETKLSLSAAARHLGVSRGTMLKAVMPYANGLLKKGPKRASEKLAKNGSFPVAKPTEI